MNIAVQNILRLSVKEWSLFPTKHCLHQVLGGLAESAFNHELNLFVQFPIWFSVTLQEFELDRASPIYLGGCLEDCVKSLANLKYIHVAYYFTTQGN